MTLLRDTLTDSNSNALPSSEDSTQSIPNILRRRIYASNIQGRGGTKIPDLKLRTIGMDFKILFECNCRQGDEKSINLNCNAVALVGTEYK